MRSQIPHPAAAKVVTNTVKTNNFLITRFSCPFLLHQGVINPTTLPHGQ
jgi:hypothetical protein